MWESLATTQRQDRVLHGAAKLLNVVVGLIALPLWLIGQRLRDPLPPPARQARRASRRRCRSPQPRERSMDALMADLEAIPNDLHHSEAAMVRKGLADISTFVLAQQREAANLGYAYPAQFSDHVFEGADGERIAATRRPPGGGRTARADRRPRPVLLAALRLRAPDRRPRLLRVGLQRRSPSTCGASGSPNLTSQAPTTRRLEGGRGHDRRRRAT